MLTTWKPTAAGVLAIAAGVLNILVALAVSLFMPVAAPFYTALAAVAVVLVLFLGSGIVAIIGGVMSLRRQRWGLALAGSICAMLPPGMLLGIASTVFVALAREEFVSGAAVPPTHYLDAEVVSEPQGQCDSASGHLQQPSEGERNA